jgi:hypothetical protein
VLLKKASQSDHILGVWAGEQLASLAADEDKLRRLV